MKMGLSQDGRYLKPLQAIGCRHLCSLSGMPSSHWSCTASCRIKKSFSNPWQKKAGSSECWSCYLFCLVHSPSWILAEDEYLYTHIYLMIYIYIHIWWIKTNQVQWPLCIVLHFIFGVVIRLPANLQDKFECKHMQTWWCCSGGWKGTSWRQWIAMDRICFF